MKKFVALFLTLVCLLWLVGCNTDDSTLGNVSVDDLDIAVSFANHTGSSTLYLGALNNDKLSIDSVRHLPIYKFTTLEELEQFKLSFGEELTMDSGYAEIPSFNATTAGYNEAFFKENTLLLVYVSANSGTYRFGVSSVYCDESSFCIHIEQTHGEGPLTDDMAGWFITVAVPNRIIKSSMKFDADLNNGNN